MDTKTYSRNVLHSPRFKKCGQNDAFRYLQGVKLAQENCRVFLPKLGWNEMRRQLEYKQLWRGGQVLAVPPAYISQRCACCGHSAKENRPSQSKFACLECGYTANADINGVCNILAAGYVVLARGGRGQLDRPSKQELTEMI